MIVDVSVQTGELSEVSELRWDGTIELIRIEPPAVRATMNK